MALISSIAYSPTLFLRVFNNVITVATGVSAVAAAVSITVVITVIIKQGPSTTDPFHKTTVILVQSKATLVFNRDIQPYEVPYYYNSTETLITLVEELNDQLKQAFPTTFIKIVESDFSTEPVSNLTGITEGQSRESEVRSVYYQSSNIISSPEPPNTSHAESSETLVFGTSKASVTTDNESTEPYLSTITGDIGSSSITTSEPSLHTDDIESTSTATTETLSHTNNIESTSRNTSQSTSTTTSQSTSITTSQSTSTFLSSYYSSTDMFSTLTSVFAFVTSTISKPFSTTTVATTTLQNNSASNCTISIFNGTKQASLIYLNGTIYFNVTNVSDITSIQIINALKSFYPLVTLINKCRNPSTAEGSFNATLSHIESPSKINITVADLDATDSISSASLNETNSATTPFILIATTATTSNSSATSGITATTSTATTARTIITTTTTVTEITPALG